MPQTVVDEKILAELRARSDGTLLPRLVDILLRDAPNRIVAMRAGIASGDLDKTASAAHALRGAAVNFGALEVVALSEEIENLCEAREGGRVSELIEALDDAYARLAARLSTESQSAAAPPSGASATAARRSIAVVEDHPINRTLLRSLLEHTYTLREYENGRSAITRIGENPPDLVLLDLGLPDMTGGDVLRALRADRNLRSLPVVALTAHAMEGDREAALTEGFDEYLTKPVDEARLMETIERLLRGERGFAVRNRNVDITVRPRDAMAGETGSPSENGGSSPPSRRGPAGIRQITAYLPPVIVFLIGIFITGFFKGQIEKNERDLLVTALREATDDRAEILQRRVDGTVEVLRSIGAFFDASSPVTREDFRTFVKGAVARHDEILAAEWLPRIPHGRIGAFATEVRRKELKDFVVREWTPDGKLVPAGIRPEYYPVLYVEPWEANRTVLGVDRSALPDRRNAIVRAGVTGEIITTEPVRLFRLIDSDPDAIGCFFVMPIYLPSTIADSVPELLGFASTVYRSSNLLDQVIGIGRSTDLQLYLFDEDAGNKLLDSLGPTGEISDRPSIGKLRAGLHAEEKIAVPGRTWTLVVTPLPEFMTRHSTHGGTMIAVAGVIISLFIAGYFFFAVNYRRRIETLVADRTSQLSRSNDQLRRAQNAAVEASEAKSRFIASMSHELRTPLNSVIGFQKILCRELASRIEPKHLEHLRLIGESGRHLLHLINQILDLSRVEAGKFELELSAIDVGKLAGTVLANFESQARDKALLLRSEIPEGLARVKTDGGRLRQILINLVGNAVKFTERGSVTIRINTDGQEASSIEVIDTGPGIPHERRDAIFERFVQADAAVSSKFGGSGLGLAISRSLCELLGFRLELESEVGRGTIFRIIMKGKTDGAN